MLDWPFQTISSNQVLVYPFPLDAFCTLCWSYSETLSHPLRITCPLASSTLYDKLKDSKGKTTRKPALQEKSDTRNHVTHVPHLDPAGICNWNPSDVHCSGNLDSFSDSLSLKKLYFAMEGRRKSKENWVSKLWACVTRGPWEKTTQYSLYPTESLYSSWLE